MSDVIRIKLTGREFLDDSTALIGSKSRGTSEWRRQQATLHPASGAAGHEGGGALGDPVRRIQDLAVAVASAAASGGDISIARGLLDQALAAASEVTDPHARLGILSALVGPATLLGHPGAASLLDEIRRALPR